MIEKWKETVDKDQFFGALLTELAKALDYLSHDLQIEKLHSFRIIKINN